MSNLPKTTRNMTGILCFHFQFMRLILWKHAAPRQVLRTLKPEQHYVTGKYKILSMAGNSWFRPALHIFIISSHTLATVTLCPSSVCAPCPCALPAHCPSPLWLAPVFTAKLSPNVISWAASQIPPWPLLPPVLGTLFALPSQAFTYL